MAIGNYHSLLSEQHPRLLIVGHSEGHISELVTMFVQSRGRIGVIGDEFPFLSNLNVMENIVLGSMYQHNISMEKAYEPLLEHIRALELEKWMNQRKELVDARTMVLCQLLRCISCGNTTMLLPSPEVSRAETVIRAVETIRLSPAVWIACSEKNAVAYDKFGFSTFHLES